MGSIRNMAAIGPADPPLPMTRITAMTPHRPGMVASPNRTNGDIAMTIGDLRIILAAYADDDLVVFVTAEGCDIVTYRHAIAAKDHLTTWVDTDGITHIPVAIYPQDGDDGPVIVR